MSSKDEIKLLLVNELNLSPEKVIFNNMKNYIINTINEPSILLQVIYNFETTLTDDNINVLKLICINEWGFTPVFLNEYAIINMSNFI